MSGATVYGAVFGDMTPDALTISGIAGRTADPTSSAAPLPAESARPADERATTRTEPGTIIGETLSDRQVRTLAEALGETLSTLNRGFRYEIDESTDRIITTIIDRQTQQVVRQIPPEEIVQVSRRLRDLIGVLLDIEV